MKKLLLLPFLIFAKELITPIYNINYNKEKALLGKKLFYDTRLSKNNTISCATCHIIEAGGDDNSQFSIGIYGQKGSINSPTVLNAVFNISQFWDGRANSLATQALGPIENPVEMGNSFDNVIKTLNNIKEYKKAFNKIYGKITKESITDAIAEYEKTLITPNSRFDRFLKGENTLSLDEKKGYELFKSYGCISCHNGVNIGGNLYQKAGIYNDFVDNNLGRYNVTKDVDDKYFFKVPTLRNINKTAPYMHNGNIKTLKEAIKVMMYYQLGIKKVDDKDVILIEKFLKTLDAKVRNIE